MITRNFWVFLHRWTGLLMAGFLIVVGATGSLLAFLPELNHLLAPQIYPGPREGDMLSLGELVRRAETLVPGGRATQVSYVQPGTARVSMTPRQLPLVPDYSEVFADPVVGDEYVLGMRPEPPPLGFDHLYLDPVTGEELGRLDKEPPITSGAGIMPFVDRLHFRLAMGEWGGWILGIVAVVWTIDCFNGLYLTLPISTGKGNRKSWQHVILDLEALLAGVDLSHDAGGATGCMSGLADPECGPLYEVAGLRFKESAPDMNDIGKPSAVPQRIFRVGPKILAAN